MPTRTDYCSVCLSTHDPEIHAATARIHAWLRGEVNRLLANLNPDQDADQHDYKSRDTAAPV